MNTIQTRFGLLEFAPEDVIHFQGGLIGFPNHSQFVVISLKEQSRFRWLQSVEEPSLAFLVAEPQHFVPDYAPTMPEKVARLLGLAEDTPRLVFTTANIPHGKPSEMTLNLAGPLLINAETRMAVQVVLEDEAYTIKHKVFHQAPEPAKVAA